MVMPSLATADDYAAYTGTDLAADVIEPLLLRASSKVRTATGQTITRVTNDAYVMPFGSEFLLPQRPADTPTSIIVNGQSLTGWTLVGQRLMGLVWEPWVGAGSYPMVVTYSHGYTIVPDEIVAIVCDVAGRIADNPENIRSVGNVTFASESLGSVNLTSDEVRQARRALGVPSAVSMGLL